MLIMIMMAYSASRAEQGHCEPSKDLVLRTVLAKLESNSEPERARESQRVAERANGSQSLSHREIIRARVRLLSPAQKN